MNDIVQSGGGARKSKDFPTPESLAHGIKPRHLGIGFVWAWVYCCFNTNMLFTDAVKIGIDIDRSWLVSAAAVAAALFILGGLWRRRPPMRSVSAGWIGGGTTAAGTLLLMGESLGAMPSIELLFVLGGLLTGVGSAILCLMWADAISRLGRDIAERVLPLSAAITIACTLASPALGLIAPAARGALGSLLIGALPLACAACLARTWRCDIAGEASSAGEEQRGFTRRATREHQSTRMLVRLTLALLVFYLIISCGGTLLTNQVARVEANSFDAATAAGAAAGLVLSMVFVEHARRTDFFSLFRWSVPIAIASIALTAWARPEALALSNALLATCDVALQSMTYLCALELARTKVMPAVPAVALTQGSLQLGVLLGNVAGQAIAPLASGQTLYAYALGMAFVLSLISLLVSPYQPASNKGASAMLGADWTTSHEPSDGDDSAMDGQSTENPLLAACSEIASRYGLSARETEVLGFLAQGRSQPFIRDELVLSKNTVASHVKHIYRKLGVHSKQEVIDLAQSLMK